MVTKNEVIRNINNIGLSEPIAIRVAEYVDLHLYKNFVSLEDFGLWLSSAFIWVESSEGESYWRNIAVNSIRYMPGQPSNWSTAWITYDVESGQYSGWDESGAYIVSVKPTRFECMVDLAEYAKTL